jgi:hypothetical protein
VLDQCYMHSSRPVPRLPRSFTMAGATELYLSLSIDYRVKGANPGSLEAQKLRFRIGLCW